MPAHAKAGYRSPLREFAAWLIFQPALILATLGHGLRRLSRHTLQLVADLVYGEHRGVAPAVPPTRRLVALVACCVLLGVIATLVVDL